MRILERIKPILSLFLIPVICVATMIPTMGCGKSSTTQIINDINIVISGVSAVLTTVDPGAPWVADLKAAFNALQTAEAGWKAGTTTSVELANALNTLAAVLAVIPFTAAYSPLIDVAIAGIEMLLPLLPISAVSAKVKLSTNPTAALRFKNAEKIHIHARPYEKNSVDAFKRVWNKTVSDNHLSVAYNL